MAFDLTINGRAHRVDADPQTPLLWIIRDHLGLTGTKFSCGIGQCGACTVHVDGRAVRSCSVPASTAAGKRVTTIEGLTGQPGEALKAAWIEEDVPQCGWCQTGQIMSAAILLAENSAPSDEDIDAGMAGNVCRCATYQRIRKAIHRAAVALGGGR